MRDRSPLTPTKITWLNAPVYQCYTPGMLKNPFVVGAPVSCTMGTNRNLQLNLLKMTLNVFYQLLNLYLVPTLITL